MTHPDPYIEEVKQEIEKLLWHSVMPLNIEEISEKIVSILVSATKTQRIKDIEEIEAALPEKLDCVDSDQDATYNGVISEIHTLLTSRKAAIEEV